MFTHRHFSFIFFIFSKPTIKESNETKNCHWIRETFKRTNKKKQFTHMWCWTKDKIVENKKLKNKLTYSVISRYSTMIVLITNVECIRQNELKKKNKSLSRVSSRLSVVLTHYNYNWDISSINAITHSQLNFSLSQSSYALHTSIGISDVYHPTAVKHRWKQKRLSLMLMLST